MLGQSNLQIKKYSVNPKTGKITSLVTNDGIEMIDLGKVLNVTENDEYDDGPYSEVNVDVPSSGGIHFYAFAQDAETTSIHKGIGWTLNEEPKVGDKIYWQEMDGCGNEDFFPTATVASVTTETGTGLKQVTTSNMAYVGFSGVLTRNAELDIVL